jgi:hypothetical protein
MRKTFRQLSSTGSSNIEVISSRALSVVAAWMLLVGGAPALIASPRGPQDVNLAIAEGRSGTRNPTELELPPAIVTSQTQFEIPFRTDDLNGRLVEVQLYVSTDLGLTWNVYARQSPTTTRIPFQSVGDGEYLFALKTLDRDGKLLPTGPPIPTLRIVVDTVQPELNLRVEPDKSGRIAITWRSTDQNLDKSTLRLSYRVDGPNLPNTWQALGTGTPATAEHSADAMLYQDRVTWFPDTVAEAIVLKAEIQDFAGNLVTTYQPIGLGSLRSANPAPPLQGGQANALSPPDPAVSGNSAASASSPGPSAGTSNSLVQSNQVQSNQVAAIDWPASTEAGPGIASVGGQAFGGAADRQVGWGQTSSGPSIGRVEASPAQWTRDRSGLNPDSDASPRSPAIDPFRQMLAETGPPTQPANPSGTPTLTPSANPSGTLTLPPSGTGTSASGTGTSSNPTSPPGRIPPGTGTSARPGPGALEEYSGPRALGNLGDQAGAGDLSVAIGTTLRAPQTENVGQPPLNISVPNANMPVPNGSDANLAVPNMPQNLSVPNGNMSVPNGNMSVPNGNSGGGGPNRSGSTLSVPGGVPPGGVPQNLSVPNGSTNGNMSVPKGSIPKGSTRGVGFPGPARGSEPPLEPKGAFFRVNGLEFRLRYQVDRLPPQQIGAVTIFGSRDMGQSWEFWTEDRDKASPVEITVPSPGRYAFRVVVTSRTGNTSPIPRPGDEPEVVVEVDTDPPRPRIVAVPYGPGEQPSSLLIQWSCTATDLGANPVALAYSQASTGPWTSIAQAVENSGQHEWTLQPNLPRSVYLQIVVTDTAGNRGAHLLETPIDIGPLLPRGRILGLDR